MSTAPANQVPIAELREREHLTPAECARVFGHSRNFWIELFDNKRVRGHRAGGRRCPKTGVVVGCRYIETASAREYLHRLNGQRETREHSNAVNARVRAFHQKFRAQPT